MAETKKKDQVVVTDPNGLTIGWAKSFAYGAVVHKDVVNTPVAKLHGWPDKVSGADTKAARDALSASETSTAGTPGA